MSSKKIAMLPPSFKKHILDQRLTACEVTHRHTACRILPR